MKNPIKAAYLPYLTLALGALGFLLQLWYNLTGVDDKGLLVTDHPAVPLTWILTVVAAILLALSVQRLGGRTRYDRMFPASLPGAVGTLAAAVGILITSVTDLTARTGIINQIPSILGFAAAAALVFLAYCRYRKLRPSFVFRCIVTVYLIFFIISRYTSWSSEPQLLRYCFSLLASVCLLAATYCRLTFDVNMGKRRPYVFFSQLAAFFCLLALPGCDSKPFYAGMMLWAALDLCSLRTFKRRREAPAAQGEAQ